MSLTPRIDNLQSYQNIAINSAMDFFQRGTSVTGLAAGTSTFLADRYKLVLVGTSAIYRMDRSTNIPTAGASGFSGTYSLAVQCTTIDASVAAGDLVMVQNTIEGYDYAAIAAGKNFRLQFWVYSVLAGTYCLSLANNLNDRNIIKEYVLTANSWTKITFDLNSDTVGTWQLDNAAGLKVSWALMAGTTFQGAASTWQAGNLRATSNQANFSSSTSNIFYLTQFMIVEGSFPSNVELPAKRAGKTVQQERQMCQRYFEKSFDDSLALPGVNAAGGVISGFASATTIIGARYVVPKRDVPTVVIYGMSTGTAGAVSIYGGANSLTAAVPAQSGISGFGIVQGTGAQTSGTPFGYHFTAEAEL